MDLNLKSSFLTLFLLLLLATPYFSKGGSVELGSDVYEIDYRGPETHSSIPPPDHSRGRKPMIRRERTVALPKSKGLRGGNNGGNNAKEIHG